MTLLSWLAVVGCIFFAVFLIYLSWVSRTRHSEYERLVQFLAIETEPVKTPYMQGDMEISRLPAIVLRKARHAGIQIQERQALLWFALTVSIIGLLCFTLGTWVGAALTATLLFSSVMALEFRARSRMRQLSAAMMGFLERMRQLITVGNSLAGALEKAVENSPPVIVSSLGPAVRRIRNGSGVAESLSRCAADYDVYELHLLATATQTNLRFGGSITHTLRNMIDNLRKRNTIERQLRADTAQVRASAWVLGILPILVAALVMFSNPTYARWFVETDAGHSMIAYALLSQTVGACVMRVITQARY